jgi:hypothetical protein
MFDLKMLLPGKSFVGEDHDSVICLSSKGSTDALSGVSHRVEGQKVVFANLKFLNQIYLVIVNL